MPETMKNETEKTHRDPSASPLTLAAVNAGNNAADRSAGNDARRRSAGNNATVRKFIGGKAQSGTYQRIINLIPPHDVYIEPFLGSGAILRMKRPAAISYGVDRALSPLALCDRGDVKFIEGCGIDFLENFDFRGSEFVYCDPPYVLSTRGNRRYYKHEMTDADHERLLRIIKTLPCPVLISGYESALYNTLLSGWHCEKFSVMTRGRTWATEVLWFNYPRPARLHDMSYVGENYRERLRIKRKRDRWTAKLAKMPELERAALFSALLDMMNGCINAIIDDAAGINAGIDAGRRPLTPKMALVDLERKGAAK